MSGRSFDSVRNLAFAEWTRRETLRLLSGAGIGLAGLAARIDAVSADVWADRKHRKKKFKGDHRCKHRKVVSLKGICVGDPANPDALFPALCAPNCFCVANHRHSRRACVQVGCEGECASDDECAPGSFCANVAGCCSDHPEYQRTCVTPCPGV